MAFTQNGYIWVNAISGGLQKSRGQNSPFGDSSSIEFSVVLVLKDIRNNPIPELLFENYGRVICFKLFSFDVTMLLV